MNETNVETMPVEEEIQVPTCPGCGGIKFKYHVTYSTVIAENGHREQTNEEIRCGLCNKKAPNAVETQVRESSVFLEIRTNEDQHA